MLEVLAMIWGFWFLKCVVARKKAKKIGSLVAWDFTGFAEMYVSMVPS